MKNYLSTNGLLAGSLIKYSTDFSGIWWKLQPQHREWVITFWQWIEPWSMNSQSTLEIINPAPWGITTYLSPLFAAFRQIYEYWAHPFSTLCLTHSSPFIIFCENSTWSSTNMWHILKSLIKYSSVHVISFSSPTFGLQPWPIWHRLP